MELSKLYVDSIETQATAVGMRMCEWIGICYVVSCLSFHLGVFYGFIFKCIHIRGGGVTKERRKLNKTINEIHGYVDPEERLAWLLCTARF